VPAIKRASIFLGRNVLPEDDDELIRDSLELVWVSVQGALEQDPKLKGRLSDPDEFLANVKHKGEQEFIKSLRDMAKAKSWDKLFDDGTFSSFDSKHSDYFLYLEVFLKKKPNVDQTEKAHNTALVEGTH
jgi:hypothetical protein